MPPFREILVGVDLSSADRLASSDLTPPVQSAVERGIQLARDFGSRLTFFSAMDLSAHTIEFLERSGTTGTVRDQAEKILASLVGRAEREGVEASSHFVFGRSWIEIIRQVLREGHDLVVVGTRGLGPAGRLLLGSTGMKLVRKCPCPVWIERQITPEGEWNVLVATDLGEIGQRATQLVIDCSRLVDMKVHLLHAIEHEFSRWTELTGLTDEEVAELHRKKREEIEHELHAQLAQTDYRTVPSGVLVHVEEGPAEQIIRDAVDRLGIHLLVMGTVSRHGLPGLILGNTAERVLTDVPCSVLVIKPRDFSSPVTLT